MTATGPVATATLTTASKQQIEVLDPKNGWVTLRRRGTDATSQQPQSDNVLESNGSDRSAVRTVFLGDRSCCKLFAGG